MVWCGGTVMLCGVVVRYCVVVWYVGRVVWWCGCIVMCGMAWERCVAVLCRSGVLSHCDVCDVVVCFKALCDRYCFVYFVVI